MRIALRTGAPPWPPPLRPRWEGRNHEFRNCSNREVYQSPRKIDRITPRNLESKYSQQESARRTSLSRRGQSEGTMPLYEYHCSACGHRFERIVKFSDAPVTTCPKCGKEALDQLISAPAVQFKGSGWYVTDYARKSSPSSSSPKSESGSETASASKDSGGADANSSASSASGNSEKPASTSAPSTGTSSAGSNNAGSNNAAGGNSNRGAKNSGAKNSNSRDNK